MFLISIISFIYLGPCFLSISPNYNISSEKARVLSAFSSAEFPVPTAEQDPVKHRQALDICS